MLADGYPLKTIARYWGAHHTSVRHVRDKAGFEARRITERAA